MQGHFPKKELQGLLISNRKMKESYEPLALPKALGSGRTRITGHRDVIAAFRPNPLPAVQFQELPSRVTASEMRTDKGRLWGKQNLVFFKNELKITSISRDCLNSYLLFLPQQQPSIQRRINKQSSKPMDPCLLLTPLSGSSHLGPRPALTREGRMLEVLAHQQVEGKMG